MKIARSVFGICLSVFIAVVLNACRQTAPPSTSEPVDGTPEAPPADGVDVDQQPESPPSERDSSTDSDRDTIAGDSDLEAILEAPSTVQHDDDDRVMVHFTLVNHSSESLYVLKWYTPLEGIAGEIFTVERDGETIPYEGIVASRTSPTPDSYVLLEPGESVSAEVDLSSSYDLSQPGLYAVGFTSPRISDVATSDEQMATTLEELGPVVIPSNTISIQIATPTDESNLPVQMVPSGPTLPPEATLPPLPDVKGVNVSYDPSLATDVIVETVPAGASPNMPPNFFVPEHVQLSFAGYALPGTFREPRIYVYPVADFEASNQNAADIIAGLRQLLADRPANPPEAGSGFQDIPFLPIFNAAQMMHSNVQYLDFRNGTGLRFLTQYGQAFVPVNNQELFYTFQGMTDDGAHYVAAIMPVSHAILPADGTEFPGGDFEAFASNFDSYVNDMEGQLSAQSPSSFRPDLALLDAMMQSLEVQ